MAHEHRPTAAGEDASPPHHHSPLTTLGPRPADIVTHPPALQSQPPRRRPHPSSHDGPRPTFSREWESGGRGCRDSAFKGMREESPASEPRVLLAALFPLSSTHYSRLDDSPLTTSAYTATSSTFSEVTAENTFIISAIKSICSSVSSANMGRDSCSAATFSVTGKSFVE